MFCDLLSEKFHVSHINDCPKAQLHSYYLKTFLLNEHQCSQTRRLSRPFSFFAGDQIL